MRWLVGDVQGCAAELDDLLRATRFDPAHDELWCLGDIINRGPDSLEAARLWRDVGGRGLLGNHEVYALCVHAGRWPRKDDTLQALYDADDGEDLLAMLRALPVLHFLDGNGGPNAWIVHAGLHPAWLDLEATARRINDAPHDDAWLESDDVSFATRVRCCTPAGERSRHHRGPKECPPPSRPWEEFYRGETLVVHGHWAWRGHYRSAKTMNLDSACVYGGSLTAWCQQEDRIVRVPARSTRARPG